MAKSGNEVKLDFSEKVVIITGSSSGIGRQTAIDFAKQGAKIVIHGQNEERLINVKKEIELVVKNVEILSVLGSIEEDETLHKIINETVNKFEKIDVLVNNAGVVTKSNADFMSIENLDYLYRVNLRGPIMLTQLAMPYLKKSHGNVINIGTIGSVRSYTFLGYYGIIKAGLDHQTRLDAQLNGPDVRVNSVLVGPIKTSVLQRHGLTELDEYACSISPLKRIGMPKEVSNSILFLACNNKASYVTGTSFVVDGGSSLNVQALHPNT